MREDMLIHCSERSITEFCQNGGSFSKEYDVAVNQDAFNQWDISQKLNGNRRNMDDFASRNFSSFFQPPHVLPSAVANRASQCGFR